RREISPVERDLSQIDLGTNRGSRLGFRFVDHLHALAQEVFGRRHLTPPDQGARKIHQSSPVIRRPRSPPAVQGEQLPLQVFLALQVAKLLREERQLGERAGVLERVFEHRPLKGFRSAQTLLSRGEVAAPQREITEKVEGTGDLKAAWSQLFEDRQTLEPG